MSADRAGRGVFAQNESIGPQVILSLMLFPKSINHTEPSASKTGRRENSIPGRNSSKYDKQPDYYLLLSI